MKKSTKLALRASELRGEINDIPAGEDGVAKRRAKLDELKTVEGEYRSALTSESESDAEGGAGGLTPEERERRALESRAELRHALHSIMNDRAIDGAAGELQQGGWHGRQSDPVGSARPAPHRVARGGASGRRGERRPGRLAPDAAPDPGPGLRPVGDHDAGRPHAHGLGRRTEFPGHLRRLDRLHSREGWQPRRCRLRDHLGTHNLAAPAAGRIPVPPRRLRPC